jgi:hypothetical protein
MDQSRAALGAEISSRGAIWVGSVVECDGSFEWRLQLEVRE